MSKSVYKLGENEKADKIKALDKDVLVELEKEKLAVLKEIRDRLTSKAKKKA